MKTKNMITKECKLCKRKIHFLPEDKVEVLKAHVELFHPEIVYFIPESGTN